MREVRMPTVVQKYGGSSVADLARLVGVADRVAATRHAGHDVVVVVSAMGGTTDELLGLARELSPAPAPRELDMLVSVGERISMALLAMALRERGIAATSLTGSQAGIVTDERHADARVVEVRADRIRAHLARGEVVVVAGFQGVSRTREVTTLGRGGSDTTAVVLAAALQAAWCELCSDVDGVWTADPRQVPDARPIDVLGVDEALALARGGAKVLFEDAVRHARDHGVALRASSTFGPGAGTRLRPQAPPRGTWVAVAGDDRLIQLPWSQVATAHASGARLRRRVGQAAYLCVRNVHRPLDGLDAVPVAVVSAVGSGVGERPDRAAEGDARLADAGIPACAAGGSADTLWWEVPQPALPEAMRALHAGVRVSAP